MTEPKRPLKVFLSYASQDKTLVRELSRRLVGEGWIDTWQDEKNLLPGQDWRVKIEEAVEEADIVIIVLSHHSVSKEGHVQKELRYAREIALEKPEDAIFLIPLRLDDCEVPRGLRFYQWVDYFGEKKETSYQALVKSLRIRHEQVIGSKATEESRKTELNNNAIENLIPDREELPDEQFDDLPSWLTHKKDNNILKEPSTEYLLSLSKGSLLERIEKQLMIYYQNHPRDNKKELVFPVINVGAYKIQRGSPRDASLIAEFISNFGGEKIAENVIQNSFGNVAYIMVTYQDTLVGVATWYVKNLVSCVVEINLGVSPNMGDVLLFLVKAIEHYSKQLECEVMLIPSQTLLSAHTKFLIDLGFQEVHLETIKFQPWLEAASILIQNNTSVFLKQIRIDRVIRPIG